MGGVVAFFLNYARTAKKSATVKTGENILDMYCAPLMRINIKAPIRFNMFSAIFVIREGALKCSKKHTINK